MTDSSSSSTPTTTTIGNVHDAQAYEDGRLALLLARQPPPLPLESRREETEKETWDDAVSLEEIAQASRTLGTLALSGNGSATCLAVDSKLIFIGMSNGSVLLLDHFGVTRGMFETVQAGPVTSLDSFQNSLVIVGYEDGRIVLWDAANPSKLLDVSAPSGIPVSTVRWYRGGIACVAIDAVGVANLFKFSKTFLISSYTADRKLLLDGRTRHGFGPIFASKVLLTDTSVGLALTVSSFTLIVRLEPEPTKIVNRWESAALASIQTDDAVDANERIPCLAYHPSAFFAQNRYQCPVVVRCFGRKVEFACLDQMLEMVASAESSFEPNSPTVACEWVSDCCISFLDANYQFQMLDTQSSLVVGRCDATRVQLVRWYLPSHPDIGTYENSIRPLRWLDETNASLYLLGVGELVKIGIQPWSVRVDRLVKSGQWLEALTLSLKYYRTVLSPLESGEDSQFKTAGLMSAIRDGSKISDLLKSYLQLHLNSLSADVGAVCVEYAISIKRFDLIFEDVFEAFLEKDKSYELMSVLYPFILAGKVAINPPPVVFDCLIQYVSANCPKESLELLFLSLRQVPFDMDGPIRLCKERQLFTAMCRLYTEGLGDFVSPVQVVLGWISKPRDRNSDTEIRGFGYRLLLFLSYCFLGVDFPKGNVPLPREKADVARVTLLSFFFPPHRVISGEEINETLSTFLNEPLFTCLDFDLAAFLKVLEQASGFEDERDILKWLVVAAIRLSTVGDAENPNRRTLIEFIARHVTHVRRPIQPQGESNANEQYQAVTLEWVLTPYLASVFFRQLYEYSKDPSIPPPQQHQIIKLVEDLIDRFPQDPEWLLDIVASSNSSAPTSPASKCIIALLRKLRFKMTPNEATFRSALDAYLQLDSAEGKETIGFIEEFRNWKQAPWFSSVLASRARDFLRFTTPDAPKLLFSMATDVEALLKELQGDAASQFALLKPLVGAQAFGEEVTLEMVETFMRLLCEREPDQAYEWFLKNEGRYPLDAALEVCMSRNIEDATAYLLERAGKVDDALNLVLRSVRTVAGLPSGARKRKLEHAATVAINLCISFSMSKHKDEMWFQVLDTFMDLPLSIANGGEDENADHHVIIQLMERIVDAMMPYVRLERILERIRQLDGAEDRFRPAVAGMLESFKREVSMYKVTTRSLKQDLVFVEQKKRLSRVKGARIKATSLATSQLSFVSIQQFISLGSSEAAKHYPGKLCSGFEDLEATETCWDALQDGDPHRLANNLLIGTKYELRLTAARPVDGNRSLPELADAGL